jgi:GyrI-like small molecule binding domain
MAGLEIVDLPSFRLLVFEPVAAVAEAQVRALWVNLSLQIEAGMASAVPDVAAVGVRDRRGAAPTYTLGVPSTGVQGVEGLQELITPDGRFAHHSVQGPYSGVAAALEMMERLLKRSAVKRGDVDLEVYRPADAEGRTRTDVYLGIRDTGRHRS